MKKIVIIGLILLSHPVLAGQVLSDEGDVLEVTTENSVHVVKTSFAPNVCNSNGLFWWAVSDGNAGGKMSVALAALASNKK